MLTDLRILFLELYLVNFFSLKDLQLNEDVIKNFCFIRHSSVAQLVEQLTVNQLVAGSSPARGAKIYYPTLKLELFVICKDLLNFNF